MVILITVQIAESRGLSSALIAALPSASGNSASSVPVAEPGWNGMALLRAGESRWGRVNILGCFLKHTTG
jgi:hypothetical protein